MASGQGTTFVEKSDSLLVLTEGYTHMGPGHSDDFVGVLQGLLLVLMES